MSQSIVGGWKPLWPRQSLPVYDDRPLQILDRLSSEGKRKLFTHHSFSSAWNYKELEWVGDAALELLARRMISRRYPQLKLGEKSRLAQTVVRGTALSRIALSIGLAKHIRCHLDKLNQDVLEDVMESLLAVMTEELGDKEAYTWLESVMSEMLEENKRRLYGPAPILVNVEETVNVLHPAHLLTRLQRKWKRFVRSLHGSVTVVRQRVEKRMTSYRKRLHRLNSRIRILRRRTPGLFLARLRRVKAWTVVTGRQTPTYLLVRVARLKDRFYLLTRRIQQWRKSMRLTTRQTAERFLAGIRGVKKRIRTKRSQMSLLGARVRQRSHRFLLSNLRQFRHHAERHLHVLRRKMNSLRVDMPEIFGKPSKQAMKTLRRHARKQVRPVEVHTGSGEGPVQVKQAEAEVTRLPPTEGDIETSAVIPYPKLLLNQRCKQRAIQYQTVKEPTPKSMERHEAVIITGLGKFIGAGQKKADAQRNAARKVLRSGLLEPATET